MLPEPFASFVCLLGIAVAFVCLSSSFRLSRFLCFFVLPRAVPCPYTCLGPCLSCLSQVRAVFPSSVSFGFLSAWCWHPAFCVTPFLCSLSVIFFPSVSLLHPLSFLSSFVPFQWFSMCAYLVQFRASTSLGPPLICCSWVSCAWALVLFV